MLSDGHKGTKTQSTIACRLASSKCATALDRHTVTSLNERRRHSALELRGEQFPYPAGSTIADIEKDGGGWSFAKLTIANAALRALT